MKVQQLEEQRKAAIIENHDGSPKRKNGVTPGMTTMGEYRKYQMKKETFADEIKKVEEENLNLQQNIKINHTRVEIVQKDIKMLKERKALLKFELKQLYLEMLKNDYYLM